MNKKDKQLGMAQGTAMYRLRKSIMFHLVQKCGLDTCYRCKKIITSIDEFSIEHKVPWLDSDNPIELFFDLDNISFSHFSCNVGHGRRLSQQKFCPSLPAYKRGCRCDQCVECYRKYQRENKRKLRNTLPENYRAPLDSGQDG